MNRQDEVVPAQSGAGVYALSHPRAYGSPFPIPLPSSPVIFKVDGGNFQGSWLLRNRLCSKDSSDPSTKFSLSRKPI